MCPAGQSGRRSISSSRARQRSISGTSRALLREMLDEVEQRLLRPVKVLEDEHQRAAPGECLEEDPQRALEILARGAALGKADRLADAVGDQACVLGMLGVCEQVGDRRSRILARGLVHDLGERPESDALAVRRQRPIRTSASAAICRFSSSASRDFPMPAGPRTVNRSTFRSRAARSKTSVSARSSLSRPSMGDSGAAGALSSSETSPRRRHASTGSSFPFTASGSTRSSSAAVADLEARLARRSESRRLPPPARDGRRR